MSNESFLSQAVKDLKLSSVAFELNDTGNAIFLLQQANEKLSKNILEKGEFFTIEKLKEFSHNAVKPYIIYIKNQIIARKKTLTKIKDIHGIDEKEMFSPDFYSNIEKFDKSVIESENFLHSPWENISEVELVSIFNQFDELLEMNVEIELPEEVFESIPKFLKENIPGLAGYFDSNPKFMEDYIKPKNNADLQMYMEVLCEFSINSLKYFYIMMNLNMILKPHVSESRYPSESTNPIFNYNDSNILVKNFKRLHNYTSLAIKLHNEAIQKLIDFNSKANR